MPYPSRIPRHLDLSKTLYSLCRSRKNRVEYCLSQVCNLLNQLDLGGGVPRTATHPESVEGIVVGDGGGEAAIENHRHRLTYHLHKAYSAVAPPPPFRIKNTVCQAASSARKPSRKDSCTSSTTISHLVVSPSAPPSSIPSLVALSLPYGPDVSPSASVSASAVASVALCSLSQYQRCSERLQEGPPDLCPRRRHTAHLTTSSVGT